MHADPRGPLFGRDEELGLLDLALTRLAAGRTALALVGEPGIGKSRLLAELTGRAAEHPGLEGIGIGIGRAAEYEQDVPFGIWSSALAGLIEARGEDEVQAALRPEYAAEFGRLRTQRFGAAFGTVDDRLLVHAVARTVIEELAGDGPLLLVLDDFHWADLASVDLLGALLRRPPAARLMLAVGLRPTPSPERLEVALGGAERDGTLERIVLRPLAPAASARLLGDDLPPSLRELLHLEAGGNPFHLEHLGRAARKDGGRRSRAELSAPLGGVPSAVSRLLADELRAVDDEARTVLGAAAVAGDPFEIDLVTAVAGVEEAEVLSALDRLVALDLVRPVADGRRLAMRHPLIRRAIYEGLGAGWRLAAHRRAVTYLQARGAAPSALAHHNAIAARPGDAAAITQLIEAGREASARAPDAAARWLEAADDLLAAGGAPAEERLELVEARTQALAGAARSQDATAVLVAALGLTDDPRRRIELTTELARFEQLVGRYDDAHERLVAALDAAPAGDPVATLHLTLALALDAFHRRDVMAQLEWGQAAITQARAGGAPPDLALALAVAGVALTWMRQVDEGDALCREAAALVEAMDDATLAGRPEISLFLSYNDIHLERYGPVLGHLARGLAAIRAHGGGMLIPGFVLIQASAASMRGELRLSRGYAEHALEAARLSGNRVSISWALSAVGHAATLRGDLVAAEQALREAIDLATGDGPPEPVRWSHLHGMLAVALAAAGDHQGAVTALLGRAGGPEFPAVDGSAKVHWLDLLTQAELARGRPEQAAELAESAQATAEILGLDQSLGMAARARAAVLLDAGEAARAAEVAAQAAELMERGEVPVEATLARLLQARALAAAGDRIAAADVLTAAVATFERCGADGYAATAAETLARLGGVRRRTGHATDLPADEGLAALSARELEIARLVAERFTNREIAERLFLSPKTVENHLRNIFAKAGVGSRGALAREVERAGEAAHP